ncbi:MAG: hypothetical protein ACREN0_06470, partial [Thermodesulfobacteriota bacterium]
MIGTQGSKNYLEEGVKITHNQTVETFRGLAATGPLKAFRTEEDLLISFSLADFTLEQYRLSLNSNVVTDVPAGSGTAGYRSIDIYLGPEEVRQMALLVRGAAASPYLANTAVQYQVPLVQESASKEIVSQKGVPIALALEFTALEDPNAASAS